MYGGRQENSQGVPDEGKHMAGLAEVAMSALGPLVGEMAASTCVRATALSIGKTSDQLAPTDMPALEASVRRLLSPVAPTNVITDILAKIQEGVR